jgi:HlyD family secretion protein
MIEATTNLLAATAYKSSASVLDPPVQRTSAGPLAEPSVEAASPPRHRLPRLFALLAVVFAAGGGLAWYGGFLGIRDLRESFPWSRKSDRNDLVFYGNVDVRQVNLSFKVEGRVVKLTVDEGNEVKAEQVLAELDQRYFDDDLRLAQARRDAQAATWARLHHGSRPEEIAQARDLVAQRQATLDRTRLEFNRAQALLGRHALAKQDYDLSSASMREAEALLASSKEALRLAELGPRIEDKDVAWAQLSSERAAVSQSERRLEDSRLVAPGNGVILTRAREVGAIVQPGETVFTLTLSKPIWVRTYIPEPDLGLVQPDSPVAVFTDSRPDKPYHGHVGYISPAAEFTPKPVETPELRTRLVYRVRIVVDDPDGGLRQGMPVTVRLSRAGGSPAA